VLYAKALLLGVDDQWEPCDLIWTEKMDFFGP